MNRKKTELPFEIGANIRRMRELRGLEPKDLCERSGLTQSALHKIETGSTFPKPETFEAIARGLEVSVSQIFGFDSKKQEPLTPLEQEPEFDSREFLRMVLGIFQYRLENNNQIRKAPEAAREFIESRNQEDTEVLLSLCALRLAHLLGHDFVNDPSHRTQFSEWLVEKVCPAAFSEAQSAWQHEQDALNKEKLRLLPKGKRP